MNVFGEEIANVDPEEEYKRKKLTLFGDFIPDLTIGKANLLRIDDDAHKDFSPYIINKFFSMGKGTIFYANEMNRYPNTCKKMVYDFYIHGVRKGKQFNPWAKPDKKEEDILLLMEYYQVNERVATQYVELLDEDDILAIREDCDVGGKLK